MLLIVCTKLLLHCTKKTQFKQAFNGSGILASTLSSFPYFAIFHPPESSWSKLQNKETRKIFPILP